jgi:DNA-binding transcriptional regulator YhcF (GntR family)
MRRLQQDARVSAQAFELAFVILQHTNAATGAAWPTQETLANALRVNPRHVRRLIRELEQAGHLSITPGGGRRVSNVYRPVWNNAPGTAAHEADVESINPDIQSRVIDLQTRTPIAAFSRENPDILSTKPGSTEPKTRTPIAYRTNLNNKPQTISAQVDLAASPTPTIDQKQEARNGKAAVDLLPEASALTSKAEPSKGNPLGWPDDAFEQFWDEYQLHRDRKDAQRVFDRIREAGKVEFAAIMAGLRAYNRHKPAWQDWKGPAAWLRAEKWTDEWNGANGAHSSTANGATAGDASIEFPGGACATEVVLRSSWTKGYWSAAWGPRPDENGCVVPADVLARIIDPALAGEAAGRA